LTYCNEKISILTEDFLSPGRQETAGEGYGYFEDFAKHIANCSSVISGTRDRIQNLPHAELIINPVGNLKHRIFASAWRPELLNSLNKRISLINVGFNHDGRPVFDIGILLDSLSNPKAFDYSVVHEFALK
jgi:hypothetical protein